MPRSVAGVLIFAALALPPFALMACEKSNDAKLEARVDALEEQLDAAEKKAATARQQFEEAAKRLVECLGSSDKNVVSMQEQLKVAEKALNAARAERDQALAARQSDTGAAGAAIAALRAQIAAAETRAWESETLLLQYLGTSVYTLKDSWTRVSVDMPPDVILRALGLPTQTVDDPAADTLTWTYTWQSRGQPVSGSVEFTAGKVTKITPPPNEAFTPATTTP